MPRRFFSGSPSLPETGSKMRKTGFSCLVLLFMLIVSGEISAITVDRVIATVNGEAVTFSDYRRFIGKIDPAADRDAVQETLLKRLIEEKILLQEAKKAGFTATDDEVNISLEDFQRVNGFTKEEFEKRLADEGMTVEEYKVLLRENLISLKLVDREVNSKVLIGDKDISAYYEKNLHLFRESPEKVLVKAIFMKLGSSPSLTEITDLKIRSLKIHADIRKGEPFEKLVMMYTDDSLKARDGVLGEFEKGMLIPALDEKIFSLRDGEVSDPVWTKEGVYILKMLKRTLPVYSPVERSKDQITGLLYEQKREEKYNEWMKKLWERSSVKIVQ